jgi:transposase
MFIRTKKTPLSDKTAVQLVENVREKGKVKQKLIRHFGYAGNGEELKALKNIALVAKLKLEQSQQPSLFEHGTLMDMITSASTKHERLQSDQPLMIDLKNIVEKRRIKIGIHQVYGQIFSEIGFDRILPNPSRKKAAVRLMRDIVLSRINQPESKLSTVGTLANEYGIEANVTSVYRMMDLLDNKTIDHIQKTTYQNTFGLVGGKTDVIFFDCTTLYFESFTEDELKANGYSKDCKFNQSQVLLALMVTTEGLPIGYELYPGSTFEGHTLKDALDKLHAKYRINKVIFVADSAMLSRDNITMLVEGKQPFIVAARIKNLSKKITGQILDKTKYKPLPSGSNEQATTTYQEIAFTGKGAQKPLRLIVTCSPLRAAKDKHDREKAIEQIKKRLQRSKNFKSLLSNYGYKKFITLEGDANIQLNEAKIKVAEQWDGLHGILSNIEGAEVKELLTHYKGLWQVEETFRISKHDLKMRPIFHWTPRRIKAHIALCFMALACVRTLEYKVHKQYKKMSPEAIRKCITQLEASILKDTATDKQYLLPSQATQDAKKIYQILHLKWHETPYLIESSQE